MKPGVILDNWLSKIRDATGGVEFRRILDYGLERS
jgi:hypothetical protein